MEFLVIGLLGLAGITAAVLLIVFLFVPLARAIGWVVKHIFTFIYGMVVDTLRFVGAIVTTIFLIPFVLFTLVIGRWSATAHYGRGIQAELKSMGLSLYRVVLGHPLRLLCLNQLTDGIENRLPRLVADAPTSDAPSRRTGLFEGYKIVGSLPVGGSGAKLYVATPEPAKAAGFVRNGQLSVGQVVIKSFSLRDGSSLPQIVREGRALDAAKKLGLVLDHDLTPERFFYVTRYVPGQPLPAFAQTLHAHSEASPGQPGLDTAHARQALELVADLLRTLDQYHKGGLFHKDVKPDNIIYDGKRAHLVDFGLVTPLRSALTLTTHGTEYYRDPEMVRRAQRGAKVHEVDGAKFDIYGSGAVLYTMFENSFPAHGVLSRVGKRCPEAVRWIIQRAMADYDKRYESAAEMLADIESVRLAADPFAVKPYQLPTFRAAMSKLDSDEAVVPSAAPARAEMPGPFAAEGSGAPGFVPSPGTGSDSSAAASIGAGTPPPLPLPPPLPFAAARRGNPEPEMHAAGPRKRAAEQLASARAKVDAARERAMKRRAGAEGKKAESFKPGVNFGVAFAIFAVVFVGVFTFVAAQKSRQSRLINMVDGPNAAGVMSQVAEDGSLTLRFPSRTDSMPMFGEGELVVAASDTEPTQADIAARTQHALSEGFAPLHAVPEGYEQAVVDSVHEDLATAFRGVGLPAGRTEPVVLVVRDFRSGMLASDELADRAIELMSQAGLGLVGDLGSACLGTDGEAAHSVLLENGKTNDATGDHAMTDGAAGGATHTSSSDPNIELVASAQFARGQNPIDSPEFRQRITAWQSANADKVDIVVWISTIRVSATHFEPVIKVVGPADESRAAIAKKVRENLLRLFAGLHE
jgi:serine/threonine protein kinase